MTRDGSFRIRMAVGLAAAALALPLPLTAASGATAPSAESGWITGVVVDAHGDPVVGNLVNVLGPKEVPEVGIVGSTDRRTWTDENGAFKVRQTDGQGYLVQICEVEPDFRRACKEPFGGVDHMITYVGPTAVTDSWVLQTSLFRPSEGDRDLGTVTVKPQSFVHGRITGAANQPIQIVRLNGTVAWYNGTDENGDYRFQGLAPGDYRIQAGGNGTGFLPFLSDVFTLEPNQDTEVDGVVDVGADIHGTLESGGKPVKFTDVLVRKLHGPLVAAVTTDEKGAYKVAGLAPGTYRLGILYYGTDYQPSGVIVTVKDPHASVAQDIAVRKGSVITFVLRTRDGQTPPTATTELRDTNGRPFTGGFTDDGTVVYTGIPPGTYTLVSASDTHYVRTIVEVTTTKTYDLGKMTLDKPTLTLTGTTAPHAVVEAKTGQECPPDQARGYGVFQFVEKADANGHYVLKGLPPGLYMLGSDGYPGNYVPHCIADVAITHSQTRDLPLTVGSTASGRLVYASTGSPVITTLSYGLTYPRGYATNPTEEHPTRGRTQLATGRFDIDRLAAGTVTGALATSSAEGAAGQFYVIFPFQDGTPYYLTSKRQSVEIGNREHVELGDIKLYVHK